MVNGDRSSYKKDEWPLSALLLAKETRTSIQCGLSLGYYILGKGEAAANVLQ
ncbi:hypothetical protein J7E71_04385 [Mesobacillus foraminis]|uniref:hypothetical protein n=1 Tax=Mesobacillus foraminis TaxID=279826 RepID=UPI001BE62071|nr:hypothetical protein [Mesobacillus foraminis]MBT2755193.1 hypothetical protein [Mesobacillus foraminis]